MKYLFVVAHPDDEAIGAGAMICGMNDHGDKASVLTLSTHSPTRPDSLRAEQAESHKLLGVERTINKSFETMRFGEYERFKIVQAIERAIVSERPDIIVTHSPQDIHNDHKLTAALTLEAARLPQRNTGYEKRLAAVLHMEVLSSTEWNFDRGFSPNAFFPVSMDQLRRKTDAIACYQQVLREKPHPRNMETIVALARLRGSQCGVDYAEGFYCSYADASRMWAWYPVPNAFFMSNTIDRRNLFVGTIIGIENNKRLRFDETFSIKEDYEISLRLIQMGYNAIRFNAFTVEANHRSKGGCEEARAAGRNIKNCADLLERYPTLIKPSNRKGEVRFTGNRKKKGGSRK